jgi:hypothetical protein
LGIDSDPNCTTNEITSTFNCKFVAAPVRGVCISQSI